MSRRRMAAAEFDHFPARARSLAREHDVIVEAHGRPDTVLVSFERYQRLTGASRTPLDVIADPAAADVEFEVPRPTDLPIPSDL